LGEDDRRPEIRSLVVLMFDLTLRTRVVFGEGTLASLGEVARELGFRRPLIVSDPVIVATGLVDRAAGLLSEAGIEPVRFHDFGANPDSNMVEAGRCVAEAAKVDSLIGLGGGSALDCAKGINFVLTNGGTMADYRGHGKATHALLPMVGVPTTAGTGSEAQSYAIISDPQTHAKMACGDPTAAFRVAILDPELTVSQPRELTAVTGFDAISHAVEAYVTAKGNEASRMFAREAWRLLSEHYRRVLTHPTDLNARAGMLLGAHWAGAAIEQSMLGATHACANPLTAQFNVTHGIAIAVMLPHVVRWNSKVVESRYADLMRDMGFLAHNQPGLRLAEHLEKLAMSGGLPRSLQALGVTQDALPRLADEAAEQWTGKFNPRPFDRAAALELYEQAF
jgi:alcohol dehydrogenase